MKRVVVIGGGITGLAAAHRLLEHKHKNNLNLEIVLVEASAKSGGIIQTEERDGFVLERGPDAFVTDKPAALQLVERLGLTSQLIPTNVAHRRSFVVRKGRLLPVPKGFHLLAPGRFWPFVTSDIFSWRAKARIARDLITPVHSGNDDESIAQFVRRRFGTEALDRMAQPMLGGIHTGDPERLSLQATFPKFREMERQHGSVIKGVRRELGKNVGGESESASGARYGLFVSFARGMQVLTDRLATELHSERICLRTRVTKLSLNPSPAGLSSSRQWQVEVETGEHIIADAVCVALPAYSAAQLLRHTNPSLAEELNAISYASSATINLAYRRADVPHPLDGFGFVVPFIEKRTLLACSFSSVKFSNRAPEGHVLLRGFVGGALQPDLIELDDAELKSRIRVDFAELLGITVAPLFNEVSRWRRSMPQYHVGHLQRLERVKELLRRLPNVALAGNAYSGVGIPDCIRSGEAAADELMAIDS